MRPDLDWTPREWLLAGAWLETGRGAYTVTMREEAGAEEVLARLAAEPAAPGRLHLGFGGWRNLDVVAARGSVAALLCDVNRHQRDAWRAVAAALAASPRPEAFAGALAQRLDPEPRPRRFLDSLVGWIEADRRRPGSWLAAAHPERYAFVRGLFAAGRVELACLDARAVRRAGPALARLGRAAGAGPAPDTIYLSNLPWMLRQPADLFGRPQPPGGAEALERGVRALAGPATRLVHAGRLAAASRPGDLRFQTVLEPAACEGAGGTGRA